MVVSWASVLLPPPMILPQQDPRSTEWASCWRYIAQFVDVDLEVVPISPFSVQRFPAFGVAFLLRLFPGYELMYRLLTLGMSIEAPALPVLQQRIPKQQVCVVPRSWIVNISCRRLMRKQRLTLAMSSVIPYLSTNLLGLNSSV
jgi:hypothetical protein